MLLAECQNIFCAANVDVVDTLNMPGGDRDNAGGVDHDQIPIVRVGKKRLEALGVANIAANHLHAGQGGEMSRVGITWKDQSPNRAAALG